MPGEIENLTKKGAEANPNGRPTRHKPIADAMKYLLGNAQIKSVDGKYAVPLPEKPTPAAFLARRIIMDALNGDSQAQKLVLERTEGKVAQPVVGSDDPSDPPVQVSGPMTVKEVARIFGNVIMNAEYDRLEKEEADKSLAKE